MDNKEYALLAEKTLSGNFYAENNPLLQNLLHAAIGLVTEALELKEAVTKQDMVNVIEEAGDALWYLSIFQRDIDYIPSNTFQRWGTTGSDMSDTYRFQQVNFEADDLQKASIELLDLIGKKATYYGKPLIKLIIKITENLNVIDTAINSIIWFAGSTPEDTRRINIAKLSARYPDGFSSYLAEHRDLAAELRILQDKK